MSTCPNAGPFSANAALILLAIHQSIAASNRLAWRKNSSPLVTFPNFKQGLASSQSRKLLWDLEDHPSQGMGPHPVSLPGVQICQGPAGLPQINQAGQSRRHPQDDTENHIGPHEACLPGHFRRGHGVALHTPGKQPRQDRADHIDPRTTGPGEPACCTALPAPPSAGSGCRWFPEGKIL